MAKRKAISKKRRFEIFKRDGFQCQYCGETPPNVILHVDHIVPVSKGGSNRSTNLITACQSCNLGKSNIPLTDVPKSLKDRAAEEAEREAQIKAYYKILNARDERLEREKWSIAEALEGGEELEEYDRSRLRSIKMFLDKITYHDVLFAAERAYSFKPYSSNQRFKYFCGICWKIAKNGEFCDG